MAELKGQHGGCPVTLLRAPLSGPITSAGADGRICSYQEPAAGSFEGVAAGRPGLRCCGTEHLQSITAVEVRGAVARLGGVLGLVIP